MRLVPARAAAPLLCCVLALCTAGCTSAKSTLSRARAGVVDVHLGTTWTDSRCSQQHFENCCTERIVGVCPDFEPLGVISAVRIDGQRVGVLLLINGDHLVLALSDDLGRSWHTVHLLDDDFLRGGPAYQGGLDLVLKGGKVWLFVVHGEVHARGQTWPIGYFAAVDQSTGKLGIQMQHLPGYPPVDEFAGTAIFPGDMEIDPSAPDAAVGQSAWQACTVPACKQLSIGAMGSDDGQIYQGYSRESQTVPECLFAYDRKTQAVTARCVPDAEWPAMSTPEFCVFPYAGKGAPVLRGFNRQGHAWATTILGSGTATTVKAAVDLGAGIVWADFGFTGRPTHRGLALVGPKAADGAFYASSRLVRVPETGAAQNVHLPRSPCADASTCGDRRPSLQTSYGQVAWVEPLGHDKYLVFYKWDKDSAIDAYVPAISASVETATYSDVAVDPAVAVPPEGPAGYPDAAPAPALLQMCARQNACGLNYDITKCVGQWLGQGAATTAGFAAARAHFLATPPGCDSFKVAKSCGAQCDLSGGSCTKTEGGAYVCTFPSGAASDCNRCSADGKAIGCKDGSVTSVLDCASVGQTCECPKDAAGTCNGPPHCVEPPCTPGTPATCVSSDYVTCAQQCDCSRDTYGTCIDTPVCAGRASVNHCGDMGAVCATKVMTFSGMQGCFAPEGTPTCNDMGNLCSGKYLLTCWGARRYWLDCAALGFATCTPADPVTGSVAGCG